MNAADERELDPRPTHCACGWLHPCRRCWPDKPPPGDVDLQGRLELDLGD